MATIAAIAQRILDENGYTTSDLNTSLANIEYLIDNAIDFINLEAGTSIADLSGTAASKSLTGSENEIVVVKALSALCLRGFKDKGPNISVTAVNVVETMTDPHYRLYSNWVKTGINRLRGRSFMRT